MICESRREPHTPSDCVDAREQRPPTALEPRERWILVK